MTLNEIALELVKLELSKSVEAKAKEAIEVYESYYARVCKADTENE